MDSFLRKEMLEIYTNYFDKEISRNFQDYRLIRNFVTVLTSRILSFFYVYELLNIQLNPQIDTLIYRREKRGDFDYIEKMKSRKLNIQILFESIEYDH